MKSQSILYEPFSITLPCIRVEQPLGAFFIASIDAAVLRQITFSDIRKMSGDRELDTYLGIQRELDPKRVKDIQKYVTTVDACFPTSVILAVEERCAEFDTEKSTLTLHSVAADDGEGRVTRIEIAKVLDGQHRIEGLKDYAGGVFQVNVSIFIDMDVANQAYLFSTVNLAQTKVKKSLVYDLYEYSRSRSPQKSAHHIAVALDQLPTSPFYRQIKRLGSATPGRKGETLTQATFVEAVMDLISTDPVSDRDLYKRGKVPRHAGQAESRKLIFRNLFIDEEDSTIADILLSYFTAVRGRWPLAWDNPENGYMLARTSGFRGLMRLLRPLYLKSVDAIGEVPQSSKFTELLNRSRLADEEFVVTKFLPGTGGESRLFNSLLSEILPDSQRPLSESEQL
ncbi:MAG: DGQHR domain-containing protein [Planctomycetota bacterium]|nr:DGQHR domain-containing protein [Planctomycetota bacterium]